MNDKTDFVFNSTELNREVGLRIASIRREAGITQGELAKRLGWKRTRITGIESGRVNHQIANLYRIAARLGCRPDDLLPVGFVDEEAVEKPGRIGFWVRWLRNNAHDLGELGSMIRLGYAENALQSLGAEVVLEMERKTKGDTSIYGEEKS